MKNNTINSLQRRISTIKQVWYVGLLVITCWGRAAFADVRLPQLVGSNMVLQRDAKVNIWGWATPGERVQLAFNRKTYKVITGSDGKWRVQLAPMKAGGPYQMHIDANNHLTLDDILIGDVFFFSGQSNMTIMMERVKERYPDEIATADLPQVKYFFVPTAADASKIHDDLPPGKWVGVDREHIMSIGAVAYFFAKKIYAKYHVPLGLINSSVGGTPIQAWISSDGLKDLKPYADRLEQLHDTAFVNRVNRQRRPLVTRTAQAADLGLDGPLKWYDPAYEANDWHSFWLPGYWADQGVKNLNGIVWFRKVIDLPPSMAGKAAKLFVGRIVDADETYVNGTKVGNITYQYPPRRYEIQAGLLKAGKNLIVVRVTNTAGKGGFVPDKRYELTDGVTRIDLRGDWQYQVGLVYPPRGGNGNFQAGGRINPQNEPAGLFNTMVAPAISYTVKGFLWYQGEANADDPGDYRALMTALISDWRKQWQEPSAPFFFVQLPNYMEVQYSPSESHWAELREAQRQTLSVPNTAMAVTIDLGEWNDIHPLNKKDVGERLALAAERLAYGESGVVWSGPTLRSATRNGENVVLLFDNCGTGLVARGNTELRQFAVAGADKHYVWAKARIEGNKVIISNPDVAQPLYIRYAWADNPEVANLYNAEGLPASPFMATVVP